MIKEDNNKDNDDNKDAANNHDDVNYNGTDCQ